MISRHKTNTMRRFHFERSILVQAAWTCGMLVAVILTFNFLPPILIQIFGDGILIAAMIFSNCLVLFTCSLLPTFHFIFHKQSRNLIKHYWNHCIQKSKKNIIIIDTKKVIMNVTDINQVEM